MLDVAGPAEVLIEATGAHGGYEVVFVSADGAAVQSSVGAHIAVRESVARAGGFDTVVIPGCDLAPAQLVTPDALRAVEVLARHARRIVSVCSGAFLLAELGLLDGRRATTHWKLADDLARRYPAVKVDADATWVRDGDVYSSAGGAAVIDLALALVEQDLGTEVAHRVAQTLSVHARHGDDRSQPPVSIRDVTPQSAVLRAVIGRVRAEPWQPYCVRDLATFANVSPRSLTRLFRAELEVSPAQYLASVRFGLAREHLEAGYSVTDAAIEAGYGSSESMRRAFVERLGMSPRTYQQRFGARGQGSASSRQTQKLAGSMAWVATGVGQTSS